MSKKKSTTYKLLRAGLILVIALVGFVAVVDRDKVPGLIEKCPWVAKIYDARDNMMAAAATKTEEKAEAPKKAERKKIVQKTAGKGYSTKERKKMDQLMSWGSQDY